MPDFTSLLNKPAGQATKPEALNVGDYPGVISGYEMGEARNEKKTPFVRFGLKLIGWPEGAEPQTKKDGSPMEVNGKTLRRDFYLTDDAMWRLDELLRGLGIDLEGKSYLEVLPMTVGSQVLVEVRQYLNQQTNEVGNEVQGLKAA